MKSLVLSAMICAATVGTSVAATNVTRLSDKVKKEQASEQQNVIAFKQAIAFHEHNVDMLFSQFERAKDQIRTCRGNHAELDRDEAFFIKVYQDDIDRGVRVEASKAAIAEIKAKYAEKSEQRDANEMARLAKLQEQLQVELQREQQQFKRAKRKYADFVNAETRPLLQRADQYFARAIDQAEHADVDHITLAAR